MAARCTASTEGMVDGWGWSPTPHRTGAQWVIPEVVSVAPWDNHRGDRSIWKGMDVLASKDRAWLMKPGVWKDPMQLSPLRPQPSQVTA